ncbi:MAG: hypothetical protein JXA73_24465 [Acidobacteria bacterium]|nr:hypothetical protein [Acidobacteriota bacterium]
MLPLIFAGGSDTVPAGDEAQAFVPAESAAEQCRVKLKSVENFADRNKPGQTQSTRFEEDEINSFLALDLKPRYHACLKNLIVKFKDNSLQATVTIDFDRLGTTSTKLLPRLLGAMISGVHTVAADGKLQSGKGRANFVLDQARFDESTLPKFLVEEIISAVGRKQKPPFDPLRSSRMPYEIDRVEVHPGYIIVFQ